MSTLIDYLNKVEKDVEKWPSWKRKSLKEAFKLPQEKRITEYSRYIPPLYNSVCIPR